MRPHKFLLTTIAAFAMLLPLAGVAKPQKPKRAVAAENDIANTICAVLANEPQSPNSPTMHVGFGMKRNDYFFSGVAEVAQANGEPRPNKNNKVLYSLQSIKRANQEGIRYFAPDGSGGVNLILGPDKNTGTFTADSNTSTLFNKPPPLSIKDTIRKTLPIKNCLSEAQTTLCILGGAGCP